MKSKLTHQFAQYTRFKKNVLELRPYSRLFKDQYTIPINFELFLYLEATVKSSFPLFIDYLLE